MTPEEEAKTSIVDLPNIKATIEYTDPYGLWYITSIEGMDIPSKLKGCAFTSAKEATKVLKRLDQDITLSKDKEMLTLKKDK